MKKTKKICKADAFIEFDVLEKNERPPTEFEYVKAKIGSLEEAVNTLQLIIRQNHLVYTDTTEAKEDIEDLTWKSLEEDD